MSGWPETRIAPWPTLSPWSMESLGQALAAAGGGALQGIASAAWPSANLAIFVPFLATERLTATRMWTYNGATAGGNVDVGIYDETGVRLVSMGSTAQSGTNAIQTYDIADTVLGPGLFYFAIAKDDATGTLFRSNAGVELFRAFGVFQQASAFPLPATATFAAMAQAYLPAFGLVADRSVI